MFKIWLGLKKTNKTNKNELAKKYKSTQSSSYTSVLRYDSVLNMLFLELYLNTMIGHSEWRWLISFLFSTTSGLIFPSKYVRP